MEELNILQLMRKTWLYLQNTPNTRSCVVCNNSTSTFWHTDLACHCFHGFLWVFFHYVSLFFFFTLQSDRLYLYLTTCFSPVCVNSVLFRRPLCPWLSLVIFSCCLPVFWISLLLRHFNFVVEFLLSFLWKSITKLPVYLHYPELTSTLWALWPRW